MLEELHISNLAVIEDTTLCFDSSYVALLGETGAGKSLIVSSLNLLLGERSDFSLMRDKEKKASVCALFTLSPSFLSRHEEVKEYVESTNLILKRVLLPDHTTRCYINDEIVSQNELKRIATHLIDIHSQNSNSDILNEKKQLLYVFGFLSDDGIKAKKEYEEAYQSYLNKKKEYQDFLSSYHDIDVDYLTFQIKEIEKYHLKEYEIEDLNEEFESLKDYSKIQNDFESFDSAVENESFSFSEGVSSILRALRPLKETGLKDSALAFEDSLNQAREKYQALVDDFSALDYDPHRIDEINERLYSLKNLQRKYGHSTEEILSKYEEYKKKLDFSSTFSLDKEKKEKEIASLLALLEEKGEKFYSFEKEAGEKLEKAICKEMADLGLRKNGFFIEFEKKELSVDGLYSCQFMVQLNEGIEKASLKKAASGGEASRLMLALKIVLNHINPYDLVVFDEIDTGVSGKQASLIAKKIKSISKVSSVLVISHLAQVVASATSAIYIKKVTEDNMTKTKASNMKEEEIVSFIAKMLSGNNVTEAAKVQAKELRDEYR